MDSDNKQNNNLKLPWYNINYEKNKKNNLNFFRYNDDDNNDNDDSKKNLNKKDKDKNKKNNKQNKKKYNNDDNDDDNKHKDNTNESIFSKWFNTNDKNNEYDENEELDKSKRFFGTLPAPWYDGNEKADVYWKRHSDALIILIGYFFASIIIYFIMFFRYKQTDVFWTVLFLSFVWTIFGAISVWYINIHFNDIFIAILLAAGFVAFQAGFVIMVMETHHQRIVYIPVKKQ